ncbi:hypothetical protein DFH08DRAFT_337698 [Mycena albidolilacea]|uniref:Uncharacterized protein n=1 Tax=Mycena albidolilacea TaxID=1033008 RepID=A0AAD6ZK42_9AGAR|nr:hypothetical protein DFH08DRAFT_337698 [Mycena albidolilacea]
MSRCSAATTSIEQRCSARLFSSTSLASSASCISRLTTSLTINSRNQYVHENHPLGLLISAPLLSNASPWLEPITVTVTASPVHYPSHRPFGLHSLPSLSIPLPSGIGTGSAGNTAQLTDLLRQLGGLQTLLTSVTNTVGTLLGTVTGLVDTLPKNVVGTLLGQTINQLGDAVNNLVIELTKVTDEVESLNNLLSGISSGAASPAQGAQLYERGQSIINQLIPLATRVNRIVNAINGSTTKPNNVAALQETLTDLENKLWTLFSGLSTWSQSPANGPTLIIVYNGNVTFSNIN